MLLRNSDAPRVCSVECFGGGWPFSYSKKITAGIRMVTNNDHTLPGPQEGNAIGGMRVYPCCSPALQA